MPFDFNIDAADCVPQAAALVDRPGLHGRRRALQPPRLRLRPHVARRARRRHRRPRQRPHRHALHEGAIHTARRGRADRDRVGSGLRRLSGKLVSE